MNELFLYGDIGSGSVSAKSVVAALAGMDGKSKPLVHIHSGGGSVTEGQAIFTALANYKGGVTTQIDGTAASIASIIALAGTRVVMAANAMLMIHNVTAVTGGDSDALRKTADLADKFNEQMVSIYAKRTGKPLARIRELMDAETFFTAKEAKEEGFIDEIIGASKMMACAKLSGVLPVEQAAILRADFQKLSPRIRAEFCRDGGRIVDSSALANVTAEDVEGECKMTRAEFGKLAPKAASKFCLDGGRIVD